ncbi:kinesin-domain-containing protein [Sanghuangporus baumii]|uniref:Kinesin-like protein n=1 Tax=Sanghuangporus baumii TaxID=108892 RepID=A0A9Q5N607_SANBA|nr:kinesin-domain-containing protein [Sanghuangporus baumii]
MSRFVPSNATFTTSGLPKLTTSTSTSSLPVPKLLPHKSINNVATRQRTAMANLNTNTLKRKNRDEDDDEAKEAMDQPRKLPAISGGPGKNGTGGPVRPVRPMRTASATTAATGTSMPRNRQASGSTAPMRGKPPTGRPPPRTRATSAPAKSAVQPRNAATSTTAARGRAPSARGGPVRPGPVTRASAAVNNQQFNTLQNKVSAIETARAADAARVAAEMEAERAKMAELQANHLTLSQELAEARNQEVTQRRELVNASGQIEDMKRRHAREIDELDESLRKKERELRETKEELRCTQEDLEREREAVTSLKATVAHQSTAHITLSAQNSALEAQLSALKSTLDCRAQDAAELRLQLENARKMVEELEEEVRDAEMTRRRLHNTIQELKGNIRVFCRVRPILPSEIQSSLSRSTIGGPSSDDPEALKAACMARMEYPDRKDHKEIVLSSSTESATGQERKETWNFSFDRVFEPHCSQSEVFEEISQLAQSCTDGYNVCIFAYGQTGSGKSYTMEGGSDEETAGMIPRAVEQVFRVTEQLKSKGWDYKMDGQFLEIYNETINDLLGKGEFDKKKHEIKHEKGSTRVTDAVVAPLKSPSQVRALLQMAQSRRTVAATLMNERSSRSHSVFTLRISGSNDSGETCEGSLNLVDLAGSERLNSSGAANDKDRLKETQNINKSLSALADVIAALGEKGDKADKHIPYRNSKLTYLLQNSLSGNSKTLMVLNLSPLAAHMGESLCSLRFATKVNNTTLGTAKRQARVAS